MNKLFALIASLGVALAGCKKPDDIPQESELPPLTQEGRDVLACRVNGVVHIYEGKPTFGDPNGVLYSPYPTYISIFADEDEYGDEMKFTLENPDSIVAGVNYYFSTESSPHYAQYFSDAANPYFLTKNGSGWIHFTRVDSVVAAGTFEFTAYFENDSVNITEGRFDIAR